MWTAGFERSGKNPPRRAGPRRKSPLGIPGGSTPLHGPAAGKPSAARTSRARAGTSPATLAGMRRAAVRVIRRDDGGIAFVGCDRAAVFVSKGACEIVGRKPTSGAGSAVKSGEPFTRIVGIRAIGTTGRVTAPKVLNQQEQSRSREQLGDGVLSVRPESSSRSKVPEQRYRAHARQRERTESIVRFVFGQAALPADVGAIDYLAPRFIGAVPTGKLGLVDAMQDERARQLGGVSSTTSSQGLSVEERATMDGSAPPDCKRPRHRGPRSRKRSPR